MAQERIIIERLELLARLGVPEEERATPQRLTATITLEPLRELRDLREDLQRTVDYAAVAHTVEELVTLKPRRLLETLAEEVAMGLLSRYPLAAVEVELRKYILPKAEAVCIQLRRERR